jgi:ATP-dependent Zn protease
MTDKNRLHTATHMMGHAIVSQLLDSAPVVKITLDPCGTHLGFVEFKAPTDVIATKDDLEKRITVAVSGLAVQKAMGCSDTSESSNLQRALQLSAQLADLESPGWQIDQPDMAHKIVERCLQRAVELVEPNMPRISDLAARLVQKGTMTGAELAAL